MNSGRAGSVSRAWPWTGGQNGSAAEAGTRSISTATHVRRARRLEPIDERPDRLDVVADVGNQDDVRPVGFEVTAAASGQRASTVRTLAIWCSSASSRSEASIDGRRVEGHDLAARVGQCPGDRQGEPAGAGPDVEPAVARLELLEQERARTGSSVRVGSARKRDRTGA